MTYAGLAIKPVKLLTAKIPHQRKFPVKEQEKRGDSERAQSPSNSSSCHTGTVLLHPSDVTLEHR
jgi:hypothetical protein